MKALFKFVLAAFSLFGKSLSTDVSLSSELDVELTGFVFKSSVAKDLWDCFLECFPQKNCQSINFNLASMTCQLNKEVKRFSPSNARPKYLGVYMENPQRGKKGSHPMLAARSCKEINDVGESRGSGQYWIDPEKTGKPIAVYCDMTTDSGGWTLVKKVKQLTTTAELVRIDVIDYRAISNYSNNKIWLKVPAIRELRRVMGFHQIRWRCHKKSLGRTLHIQTANNSNGYEVLRHFLDKPSHQAPACNSFIRLPDDNSILAQNCNKWGNLGNSRVEVNRWGRSSNTGDWRIYNNAIVWEGKHYLTFVAPNFFCDDFTGNEGALSVGDQWELYVR